MEFGLFHLLLFIINWQTLKINHYKGKNRNSFTLIDIYSTNNLFIVNEFQISLFDHILTFWV
jgi:hypothetical protein